MKSIRWLAVLPAFLVGYVIMTWLYFFGLNQAIPTIAAEVRYGDGFAGHYFLGPLIVFGWFATATFFAAMGALRTAPSHRAYVSIFIGILILAFIILGAVGAGISITKTGVSYEIFVKSGIQLIAHDIRIMDKLLWMLGNPNQTFELNGFTCNV